MSFAERVKALKSERSITSEQLSRASGIPLGTLTKILSGATGEPKLSVALAIAEAFDCPIGMLLDGDGHFSDTLGEDECRLIKKYRRLDEGGRELVEMVMDKEISRLESTGTVPEVSEAEEIRLLTLPLFMLPVSAGPGTALDENNYHETIEVRATRVSIGADYALRVSGNSMEPKFEDGDILLVKRQNAVDIGDLGIFIADGEGYFKRYTGKCLRSYNPAYQDIPISNFAEFRCCGKVIGRMRRRRIAV
ncbi:MAG: helix-turn-helix domain-containing protein [Clostridia bacterium]|nr:helix-turn-helix domain-containing protein [Clostridia bacterium]